MGTQLLPSGVACRPAPHWVAVNPVIRVGVAEPVSVVTTDIWLSATAW